uniref:Uncharacterized protein n=1 Tax=Anguilla anguilla TaxID=7936 RepID=A0A0E9VK60_ANGAN
MRVSYINIELSRLFSLLCFFINNSVVTLVNLT